MTTTQQNGALVYKPGRNIVASQLPQLREELNQLIQEGHQEIAIDLEKVEIIDSKGLALFMQCHHSLSERSGSLIVLTSNPDFKFMFHAMRLDQHFSIRETL